MANSLFNLIVFISIILVQIVFLVLRLNHNIEWLWSLVLIPYWVLSAIGILIYINIVVSIRESQNVHDDSLSSTSQSSINPQFALESSGGSNNTTTTGLFSVFGTNSGRYPSYVYYGINLFSVLAFIILVDLQLDLAFATWSIVFVPLWVALGIDLLWIIWESNRYQENWRPLVPLLGTVQQPLSAPLTFATHKDSYVVAYGAPSSFQVSQYVATDYRSPYASPSYQQQYRMPPQLMFSLARVVLLYASLISFSIVLALELDAILDTRWEYIFIPVWIVLFIWLLSLVYDVFYKYFLRRYDNRPYKPWSQLLMEFILFAGILVFALFLQEDLIEHETIDPLVVFSPLFIAFFILFWIVWTIYYFTPIPGTMGVALPSSPMHWALANTHYSQQQQQNGSGGGVGVNGLQNNFNLARQRFFSSTTLA